MKFGLLTIFLFFIASPIYSMNTFTALGPTFIDERPGSASIIFKGHNNHHIWQAKVSDYKIPSNSPKPNMIEDNNGSFAMTSSEPAVTYWKEYEIRHPILIFRGHNNRRIWYTYRWSGNWAQPRSIGSLLTNYTPAIINYFDYTFDNQIIAYTKDDNTIVLRKGSISNNRWGGEIRLPGNPKTTRMGPVLFYAHQRVYVFWRGEGEDARIHYAYSRTEPTSENWGWQRDILPRAFTANYDGGSYQFSPLSITFYGRGLLIAYKGHNNDGIFLRLGGVNPDGTKIWSKVGQVPGVYTKSKPGIIKTRDTTYLALKSKHSNEICIGELRIDNGPPRWTSIRQDKPDLNCGN